MMAGKSPVDDGVPVEVKEYEVQRTLVKYGCPRCGDRLRSKLQEAGQTDECPVCSLSFIVPGVKEWMVEEEKLRIAQIEEEAARKFNQHQKEMKQAENKAKTIQTAVSQSFKNKKLQLDRDPMIEWYIYAAICFIFLALIAGPHLYTAVATDSTFLCLVIILLFLVGIVLNFIGVRQLRIEYVCAAACMDRLRMGDGLKKILVEPPAGVFHHHVQDLANIAKYDKGFTQDSLVTLLYSRLMAKAKVVEILSSILVSLGLIGTVLGLIVMTGGLATTMDSLSGNDTSSLLGGMRATMGGLGTAFYTTLLGAMFGSVVLRMLNNVYTSNVDYLVSYVASTAEVRIVPRLKVLATTKSQEIAE